MTTFTLPATLAHEARYALIGRIDRLRQSIAQNAHWTVFPVAGDIRGPDQYAAAAVECALWQAQAEHAYRLLGGTNPRYLPAPYREVRR